MKFSQWVNWVIASGIWQDTSVGPDDDAIMESNLYNMQRLINKYGDSEQLGNLCTSPKLTWNQKMSFIDNLCANDRLSENLNILDGMIRIGQRVRPEWANKDVWDNMILESTIWKLCISDWIKRNASYRTISVTSFFTMLFISLKDSGLEVVNDKIKEYANYFDDIDTSKLKYLVSEAEKNYENRGNFPYTWSSYLWEGIIDEFTVRFLAGEWGGSVLGVRSADVEYGALRRSVTSTKYTDRLAVLWDAKKSMVSSYLEAFAKHIKFDYPDLIVLGENGKVIYKEVSDDFADTDVFCNAIERLHEKHRANLIVVNDTFYIDVICYMLRNTNIQKYATDRIKENEERMRNDIKAGLIPYNPLEGI